MTPSSPTSDPLGPFGRLAAAVLRRRRLTLVLAVLAMAVSLAFAVRIQLNFSSTAFYGGDDPEAAALEAFVERWGSDDSTLYVLAETEPPGVLDVAPLAALQQLREALAAEPGVVEVLDIDVVTPSLGPGDVPLHTSFETSDARTHEVLRGVMLSSPVVPRLLSADGTRTVLAVRLDQSSDDVQAVTPVVERLDAVVERFDQQAGLHLQIAGVPAIRASFFALAIGDQLTLGPIIGLTLALLLWLAFGRLHGVVIPLTLTAVPIAALVGLMAATDEPIGLLNQAYFTLLPVIAVADAVHLVARMHQALRQLDADPNDADQRRRAVLIACDRVGAACLLTSLTTGLGFASLTIASMPMLRDFGLYATLGIGLAFLALLLLGPLLLDTIRTPPPPRSPRMLRLARWSAHRARPGLVALGCVTLAALAALGARSVVVDNYLSDLLSPEHPVRQASARMDEHLGGTLALEIELSAEEPWLEGSGLAAAKDFERWAAEQPSVRTVLGPGVVHWLTPSFGAVPPEVEALRQRVVDASGRRARVSLLIPDIGGRSFIELAERVEEHADTLPGEAVITGTPLLAYRGVNRIAGELLRSLLGVIAVVTLAIAVLLRSLRLSLLALIPNVMPLALAYAGLGLLGITLDPLAACILCVALSIAVDDSLHLLSRFRDEQARGAAFPDALERAIATSGHAALITSVALSAGLAVNLASSFPPLVLLGGLGATTIALAWLFDVIVLPALLRLASDRSRPAAPTS